MRIATLLLVLAVSSCSFSLEFENGLACSGAGQCPGVLRCVDNQCRESDPVCGDYEIESGEVCDDGANNGKYGHCKSDCSGVGPRCGDGNVDADFEACEPGLGDPCLACALDCSEITGASICGDGARCLATEACDDGYEDACGSCNADCSAPGTGSTCGDGEACPETESCDDGFQDACGSCNATCDAVGEGSSCGDWNHCPETEDCDDGFNDSCGTCNATCTAAGTGSTCGDGQRCPETEACDDNYEDDCGTCNSTCSGPGGGSTCGDASWCPETEPCDDGANGNNCDGCLDDCSVHTNVCGDTYQCGGEQCDDGANGDNCDGCLDNCTTHVNICGDTYQCELEQCDDGANGDNCDGCLDDCTTHANTCGDTFICGAEECDDGNAVSTDACDACSLSEVRINTTVDGAQRLPCVAAGLNGTWLVAWTQTPNSQPATPGAFFQRFDSFGSPLGSETQLNTSAYAFFVDGIACDVGPSGAMVVIWTTSGEDGTAEGLYGRLIDSSGVPQGAQFAVNSITVGNEHWPDVGMASDGSFVVTWESDSNDIHARLFNSAGVPGAVEFQVNFYAGSQSRPAIAVDGDGSFIVAWAPSAPNPTRFRRFDSGGSAVDLTDVNAAAVGADSYDLPSISMNASGDFSLSWHEYYDSGPTGPRYRDYNANGTPKSAAVSVPGGNNASIALADDDSLFLVIGSLLYSGGVISGYRVDSSGTALDASPFTITNGTSFEKRGPRIDIQPDGAALVVWDSAGEDSDGGGVFGKFFPVFGTP